MIENQVTVGFPITILFSLLFICTALTLGETNLPNDPLAGTGDLFAAFYKLDKEHTPIICYIITQDPHEIREEMKKPDGLKKIIQFKSRIEELSGLPCVLVHYMQLMRDSLNKPNIKAIVITAWKKLKDAKHAAELDALIRETQIPTLGICGGHHLIYKAYGGKTGMMRKLRPGETDPYPSYYPGYYKEWNFCKVKILKRDSLFTGLGDEIIVPQRHAAQCTELPQEFELLATSDECKVQVIKHKDKPLYGTQFHPELYDQEHPDGKRILQNFFRLATK